MPQDKTLYPRLKKLFSTDVVVRNIGGKMLKVLDIEKIQSFGMLQTNSLVDRFTRLHKAGSRMQFNPTLNYQTLRLQLYTDYEAMDTDGIISAALDIIAAESTIQGETNEVLRIRSSDENIQRILYNLFYDILNIEFNLPMWIRSMCKYGDMFLRLQLAEKYGVIGVKPLSVYDMQREEGQDPDMPAYTRFIYDPVAIAGGTQATKNKEYFENFEIAHFRLLTDSNYLPFGRSYLEPARKYFKQYTLMMDAMLLHRIMRAPEKRVFYINIGNIPPQEVDAYMEMITNKMKKTPFKDEVTGDYNLKFNVQNLLEDFYIPVRPGDTTTKIDTTKGLDYTGIEDVEFLRDLMLAALKVPKSFLNYSDELAGKSTISALDIIFSRLIEYIQRIAISELSKIAVIHLYIQGYEDADLLNFELRLNNPSIIYEQERVALLKEKIELWKEIQESKIFSSDWFYDKIFDMSEDQWMTERDLVTEDVKRAFRYSQIENEGNDPQESGQSYGTQHDLATIYKSNATNQGKQDVPDGYDEKDIPGPGRPKEKASIYSTDQSAFGRDPLGKKGYKTKDTDQTIRYKNNPKSFALENILNLPKRDKKVMIFEDKKDQNEGFLNEDNLLKEEDIKKINKPKKYKNRPLELNNPKNERMFEGLDKYRNEKKMNIFDKKEPNEGFLNESNLLNED